MEFLGRKAFNNSMRSCNISQHRQRLIAGLVLGLFALQAAQASLCCDFDLESASNATLSQEMPCRGNGVAESDHGGNSCLSCVSMLPAVEVVLAAAVLHHVNATNPAYFDLATRQDLLYRPPIDNPL